MTSRRKISVGAAQWLVAAHCVGTRASNLSGLKHIYLNKRLYHMPRNPEKAWGSWGQPGQELSVLSSILIMRRWLPAKRCTIYFKYIWMGWLLKKSSSQLNLGNCNKTLLRHILWLRAPEGLQLLSTEREAGLAPSGDGFDVKRTSSIIWVICF